MEKCARCGSSEEDVRLFDGIYVNEPIRICEKCALLSNIPLIKRPNPNQLKESEKPYGVRERLNRMAHLDSKQTKNESVYEELKKIEAKPELIKPDSIKFKLVDNYHWELLTSRRRRGLSTRQLAEAINESESAIKMLEKNMPPENSYDLIRKLEQFFQIRLIKKEASEVIREETDFKRVELIKKEHEIRKEELELGYITRMKQEEGEDLVKQAILAEKNPKALKKEEVEGYPLTSLDFHKAKKENLTIAELKNIGDEINSDMEYPKKTRDQVGKEQVEDIGKEDIEQLKKTVYRSSFKKESKSKVPTIYELMDKKKERDKQALLGKEVKIDEDDIW